MTFKEAIASVKARGPVRINHMCAIGRALNYKGRSFIAESVIPVAAKRGCQDSDELERFALMTSARIAVMKEVCPSVY